MYNPYKLRLESKNEIYELIDKHLKKLPRNPDGSFNEGSEEFHNNDVDALRHAYVSGIFTQKHGEHIANLLGILNELTPLARKILSWWRQRRKYGSLEQLPWTEVR